MRLNFCQVPLNGPWLLRREEEGRELPGGTTRRAQGTASIKFEVLEFTMLYRTAVTPRCHGHLVRCYGIDEDLIQRPRIAIPRMRA